ncbi:unnamed protein product [Protopolystoma xenopodis]|uniref:Uncharacterized protein n=1 Tax=Protopolystoma xenopodis TaxID=117903 RepID=A0A3S5A2V7_9PLAT|nr:unnamed protein product [Protopolystoma xenopodis]
MYLFYKTVTPTYRKTAAGRCSYKSDNRPALSSCRRHASNESTRLVKSWVEQQASLSVLPRGSRHTNRVQGLYSVDKAKRRVQGGKGTFAAEVVSTGV